MHDALTKVKEAKRQKSMLHLRQTSGMWEQMFCRLDLELAKHNGTKAQGGEPGSAGLLCRARLWSHTGGRSSPF